ncbi:alpha-L-fucosidase [Paraflavitalea sp. CAU 1676]|uniref:alpha-L-fucosidase n=1 Tax=Paraflavitalea sp. CAU 1676 TaxID=3032598 RepID=UPI0023DC9E2D|nr:alpha-L-fucosidase [Paraflavitalea sp. CAU 1676]MDF2187314.1 alpha-L-fucosidase [Paraflavitalea sp. CAU 1676]
MTALLRSCAIGIFAFVLSTQPLFAQKEQNDNRFGGNKNTPARQEWLRDLGFGMFIHFNVDAQLGITISHSLVGASEDYVQRYYNELPQTFDPAKFDAFAIAKLARLAGMKYVVFTAKHHSGFCFWDTKTTSFKITNTPYKADLLKKYVDGVRKAGLAVGLYYSPEDFKFLHDRKIVVQRGDIKFDKATQDAYDDLVKKQTAELFSQFGKIDVLFIDGEPKEPCKEVAWKLQPSVVITRGAVNTPEQTLPGVALDEFWESCVTMGTQWNYKPTHDDIKPGGRLIELLVEARAKGGNFLLNVGPHPDGYIPYEQETQLREVAAWHFINHEAIESVRPWIVTNEQNIWFTASKDKRTVYAVLTGIPEWPKGARKEFVIGSIKITPQTKISVLGQNDLVTEYNNGLDVRSRFQQQADGLHISVARAQRVYDNYKWPNPITVKLENVLPALDPPVIETLRSSATAEGLKLDSRLVKKGDAAQIKVYFEYRPYAGFAENLYSTTWLKSEVLPVDKEGAYSINLAGLEKGREYEFRAVVEHPVLTVRGDTKRIKTK